MSENNKTGTDSSDVAATNANETSKTTDDEEQAVEQTQSDATINAALAQLTETVEKMAVVDGKICVPSFSLLGGNVAPASPEKQTGCVGDDSMRQKSTHGGKYAAALDFFNEFGFVCLDGSQDEKFIESCLAVERMAHEDAPSGHEAFAFLHQDVPQTGNTASKVAQTPINGCAPLEKTDSAVQKIVESTLQDFVPDALSHSQAAWDVRGSGNLLDFFAQMLSGNSGDRVSPNRLLPSIERVSVVTGFSADKKGNVQPTDVSKSDLNKSVLLLPRALPTFNCNPIWRRKPGVVAAYHLDAHAETLMGQWSDYCETFPRVETESMQVAAARARMTKAWCQRVQSNLVSTIGRLACAKRATNKLVMDGLLRGLEGGAVDNQKPSESASQVATTESTAKVVTMTSLEVGVEAFVVLGNADDRASDCAEINIIPGFQRFFHIYFALIHNRWAKYNGNSMSALAGDTLFDKITSMSVTLALKPGSVFVFDRRIPHWAGTQNNALVLPVSYQNKPHTRLAEQLSQIAISNGLPTSAYSAICPLHMAQRAAYLFSISRGIVLTSVPQLTGAQEFRRSTNKASNALAIDRRTAYNAWLADHKDDNMKASYHYTQPTIRRSFTRLLDEEAQATAQLDFHVQALDGFITQVDKSVPKTSRARTSKKKRSLDIVVDQPAALSDSVRDKEQPKKRTKRTTSRERASKKDTVRNSRSRKKASVQERDTRIGAKPVAQTANGTAKLSSANAEEEVKDGALPGDNCRLQKPLAGPTNMSVDDFMNYLTDTVDSTKKAAVPESTERTAELATSLDALFADDTLGVPFGSQFL